MENASKALIIAGGILIAMLVLSIAVYLFTTYASLGETYDQTLSATEIQKFNANFTKFDGREDIIIQEIVSLANFVRSYNEQTGEETVNVSLGTTNLADSADSDKLSDELIDTIKKNSSKDDGSGKVKLKYFKCENIKYNDKTGLVEYIKFSESP